MMRLCAVMSASVLSIALLGGCSTVAGAADGAASVFTGVGQDVRRVAP